MYFVLLRLYLELQRPVGIQIRFVSVKAQRRTGIYSAPSVH